MYQDIVLIDGKDDYWYPTDREDKAWQDLSGRFISLRADIPQPHKYAVIVPMAEFNRLCRSDALLGELEAAGVDNWDGHPYAVEQYEDWLANNPQYQGDNTGL